MLYSGQFVLNHEKYFRKEQNFVKYKFVILYNLECKASTVCMASHPGSPHLMFLDWIRSGSVDSEKKIGSVFCLKVASNKFELHKSCVSSLTLNKILLKISLRVYL